MTALSGNQLKRRGLVMGCCWLMYTIVYLLRNNLSVALPYIEAEYGISRASLGFMSSVFLWVYGLGQLVNGYIGDRISAKYFMLLGLGMASLMNAFFAMTHSYWMMVLCWAANGWFQSMLWGPIIKTVANWYEPGKGGRAMIAISTSTAVGGLLAMGLSGLLASDTGWRNIFLVPALIGGAYLALHLRAFQDRPANAIDRIAALPNRPAVPMAAILRRRDVQWVTLACFCQGIVRDGISLWAALFFMEAYGLDVKRAVLFALVIPAANFLGVIAIGQLYRKFPRRLARMAALTFLTGALMTGALSFLWGMGALVAMALLALASGTMCAANTLLLGVYPISFAEEDRVSSVTGLLEFSAYLAAGCTAVLSGFLLDRMGWQGVIALWLGVALAGAAARIVAEKVKN
ncbi:MAG: MFS transporter [Christensenellaceae bacterium]|nr:MFS transporter [Christensenellaceae bacterium]